MFPTRRNALVRFGGLAVAGLLVGCTGPPQTDGGQDEPTDSPATPGTGSPETDDGDGAGDGDDGDGGDGTETGLRVAVTATDDAPDLPVRPGVEVVRATATSDHPPQLRTTLTNTTDESVTVGEGRAVHFMYVSDDAGTLILLSSETETEYPAEPGCWRLTEGIAITEEYRMLDVEPGTPSARLVDLYATAGGDGCLPTGASRFETTIAVVTPGGEMRDSATWGFSVELS